MENQYLGAHEYPNGASPGYVDLNEEPNVKVVESSLTIGRLSLFVIWK